MSHLIEVNYDLQTQCQLRSSIITNDSFQDAESVCAAVWDSVYCWPPTPPGSIIKRSCSELFQESYKQFAKYLKGHVTRECLENGTWAQGNTSNYDDCAESFQSYINVVDEDNLLVPMVHHMLFYGSILSLLCLVTSLGIFHNFPCLRCDRVAVNLQLIHSLMFRFVLMFIIAEPFVIGHSSSYRDVEVLCKIVLVTFLFTTFSSVSWMFVQGLFLNVILMTGVVQTCSSQQFRVYYIIGWGVPALFVGAHVTMMTLKNEESCWKGYSEMDEMWILLGPITLELLINGIFLINILRILMKKIRTSNTRPDMSQLKAAAKGAAILFPVLGINNLILLYNPGGNYNKYFVLLNAFFGSTQGIFVSIVLCFTDKEVCAAIKRAMNRRNARRMETTTRAHNSALLPLTPFMKIFNRRVNTHNNNIVLEHSV